MNQTNVKLTLMAILSCCVLFTTACEKKTANIKKPLTKQQLEDIKEMKEGTDALIAFLTAEPKELMISHEGDNEKIVLNVIIKTFVETVKHEKVDVYFPFLHKFESISKEGKIKGNVRLLYALKKSENPKDTIVCDLPIIEGSLSSKEADILMSSLHIKGTCKELGAMEFHTDEIRFVEDSEEDEAGNIVSASFETTKKVEGAVIEGEVTSNRNKAFDYKTGGKFIDEELFVVKNLISVEQATEKANKEMEQAKLKLGTLKTDLKVLQNSSKNTTPAEVRIKTQEFLIQALEKKLASYK